MGGHGELGHRTLGPHGDAAALRQGAGGGGNRYQRFLSSAELYDPATGTWTATDSLDTARAYHTATLLISGEVLVAAGFNTTDRHLFSAELYDPANGTWTATGSMSQRRAKHTATLLPNGQVLVAEEAVARIISRTRRSCMIRQVGRGR